MNWYRIAQSQSGEWWIIDGQAFFADSNTGEMGHEAYVLDSVRKQITETFGFYEDEHYDWDEVKQQCIATYFDELDEEDQGALLKKWDAGSKEELIEKVPYDSDIFDSIALQNGNQQLQLDVADNVMDPRDYGMKELGWKRVEGKYIQTWTLTSTDLNIISRGIDDILSGDYEGKDPEYTIEVMSTKKMYTDIPLSVIEQSNPMGIREYQHSYKMYAKDQGWYKRANRKGQQGRTLPETGYEYSLVKIYRAVPKSVLTIGYMDYITLSKKFAVQHAESMAVTEEDDQHVLSATVKAKYVAEASNAGEYFYIDDIPVKGKEIHEAKFADIYEDKDQSLY